MTKSFKEIIQKYIILKINSSQWKSGDLIPSENVIAQKFKCSRLTARNSLQALVHSGVLKTIHGKGYVVHDKISNSVLYSYGNFHKISRTEISKIEDFSWMIKFFKLKKQRIIAIMKKYYKNNEIFAIQFSLLNKEIIWEANMKQIKKSITTFLANQGVAIKWSDISVIVNPFKNELIDYAKQLKWKNNMFPIEVINSFSQDGWIEKTIRITIPNFFQVNFRKENY